MTSMTRCGNNGVKHDNTRTIRRRNHVVWSMRYMILLLREHNKERSSHRFCFIGSHIMLFPRTLIATRTSCHKPNSWLSSTLSIQKNLLSIPLAVFHVRAPSVVHGSTSASTNHVLSCGTIVAIPPTKSTHSNSSGTIDHAELRSGSSSNEECSRCTKLATTWLVFAQTRIVVWT